MAEITLQAEVGRETGSRASRRLIREGRIPAVIYGHRSSPVPVSVDARELRAALTTESGLNALLTIEVDEDLTYLTMAKELQRHPVRGTVTHVDFLIVRRDEVVTAEVPVVLVGEALAVTRAGGVVEQQLYTLTVSATPDRLPRSIEVDVTALDMGGTIRLYDVGLPEGVSTDVEADEALVMATEASVEAESETPAAEEEPDEGTVTG